MDLNEIFFYKKYNIKYTNYTFIGGGGGEKK